MFLSLAGALFCGAHASLASVESHLEDPAVVDSITDTGFSPGKASFTLRVKGDLSPYRVFGVYVLPNEPLTLEIADGPPQSRYRAESSGGRLHTVTERRWEWRGSEAPGMATVRISQTEPVDSILLNVFVMVPFDRLEGKYLNGYRIGSYPRTPLRGLSIYAPPKGFIEVTPENQETLIAPHFRLRQFLCKQKGGWPKYVVLRERLLLKLELLLAAANEGGYSAQTFAVLSGYRTPYYNALIGNVRYSRHVWGDAADIYIDESPRDGTMDDLNGDGRIDYRDAALLYDLVESLSSKRRYLPFLGGLGRYRKTSNHGPFVHVDARGYRARWGR